MWNLLNEWKAEVMEHEAGKYVQKTKSLYREQSAKHTGTLKPEVPQGLLRKCNKCGAAIVTEDVKTETISARNAADISGSMHIQESV